LEFRLYLGPRAAIAVSPIDVASDIAASALSHATVENYLNSRIRREPFPEISIQIRVLARDNKQGPGHELLGLVRETAVQLMQLYANRKRRTAEAYRVPGQ
jgi:hypothetical protein